MDFSALLGQVQAMMQPYEGSVNWNLARDVARRAVAAQPDPSVGSAQERRIADAITLGRPLARRGHRLPQRHRHHRRLEPRAVDRGDGADLAPAGRAGRPARRRRDGRGAACRGQGDGRPADRACSARPVARSSAPRSARRSVSCPPRCSPPPTSACRWRPWVARPWCPTTSPSSPRASTCPRRTSWSSSRCARPPTSGCTPTCRGCAATSSARSRTTAAAPRSTSPGSRSSCAASTRPTRPRCRRRWARACSSRRRPPPSRPRCNGSRPCSRWSRAGSTTSSAQAAGERLPSAVKLREIVRRRRAAGGPAEDTFAALVGLELRPRRLRDAAALWANLRSSQDAAARDAVWAHPDLMPTSDDLDDPLGYAERRTAQEEQVSGELQGVDFDAELAKLLDGGPRRRRRPRRSRRPRRLRRRRGGLGAVTAPDARQATLQTLRSWEPPTLQQSVLQRRFVDHLQVHADGLLRSCRPDHLTASVLVMSPDTSQVLLTLHAKAGAVVPAGRPPRADRRRRGRGRHPRGARGVGHLRSRRSTPSRCTSTSTRCPSAARTPTTSTSASSPSPTLAPATRSARSRTTLRWWSAEELPGDGPSRARRARPRPRPRGPAG